METQIKFLDKVSEALGSGKELSKISSHFCYLRSVLLQHGGWDIRMKKDNLPSMCAHCFMEFRGTAYTVTVKPSRKPNCKMLRLMEKKAMSEKLTSAETLLLTRYEDSRGKTLVLKCDICQKETRAILRKLKEDPRTNQAKTISCLKDTSGSQPSKIGSSAPPPKAVTNVTPHFKKKKKKDQFAGLKKTAVLSLKAKKNL